MLTEGIIIIVAFIGLIISGELAVKGSVGIGDNFRISKMFIGLVIVSAGTSFPELFVGINAVKEGFPEMALGNIIGSNIINVGLVLGISSFIFPIVIGRNTIRFDLPFLLVVTVLFMIFAYDNIFTTGEGIVLIIMFVGFIYFQIFFARGTTHEMNIENRRNFILNIVMAIVGFIGLAFCSKHLVSNSALVAQSIGISDRIIGLTLFAFGTSLPELVTTLMAAKNKQNDLMIGNIIGSNLFNITLVGGITSLLKFENKDIKLTNFDMPWMLGIEVLLLILLFTRSKLSRIESVLLLSSFAVYMYFVIN